MLPEELYTKGVPGIDEVILACDYAEIANARIDDIIDQIRSRRLLGVCHHGTWFVEAPPLCQSRLEQTHYWQRHNRRWQTTDGQLRSRWQDADVKLRPDALLDRKLRGDWSVIPRGIPQKRLGATIEAVQKGSDWAPEGAYRHILLMSRKMA